MSKQAQAQAQQEETFEGPASAVIDRVAITIPGSVTTILDRIAFNYSNFKREMASKDADFERLLHRLKTDAEKIYRSFYSEMQNMQKGRSADLKEIKNLLNSFKKSTLKQRLLLREEIAKKKKNEALEQAGFFGGLTNFLSSLDRSLASLYKVILLCTKVSGFALVGGFSAYRLYPFLRPSRIDVPEVPAPAPTPPPVAPPIIPPSNQTRLPDNFGENPIVNSIAIGTSGGISMAVFQKILKLIKIAVK